MNILMQVHIPDWDVQGNLNFEDKIKLVDFVIEYMKKKNPNDNLYLSGHGHRPTRTDLCTDVYWENVCRNLNGTGFVDKMPAQHVFVSRGLDLIQNTDDTLRTRGDSIIGIPNICTFCKDKLGDKTMIITQQTNNIPYKMGDFFHFGKLDFLKQLWSEDNPIMSYDGLEHIGKLFISMVDPSAKMPEQWHNILLQYCFFLDLYTLQFMDLRWNYHRMSQKYGWNTFTAMALNDEIDFRDLLWGNFAQWPVEHRNIFDANGNLMKVTDNPGLQFFSEKTFYHLEEL